MGKAGHPFFTQMGGKKNEGVGQPMCDVRACSSISLREKCREDFVEESELCADAVATALDAKLV